MLLKYWLTEERVINPGPSRLNQVLPCCPCFQQTGPATKLPRNIFILPRYSIILPRQFIILPRIHIFLPRVHTY